MEEVCLSFRPLYIFIYNVRQVFLLKAKQKDGETKFEGLESSGEG